jgi:hypothetical protein
MEFCETWTLGEGVCYPDRGASGEQVLI